MQWHSSTTLLRAFVLSRVPFPLPPVRQGISTQALFMASEAGPSQQQQAAPQRRSAPPSRAAEPSRAAGLTRVEELRGAELVRQNEHVGQRKAERQVAAG